MATDGDEEEDTKGGIFAFINPACEDEEEDEEEAELLGVEFLSKEKKRAAGVDPASLFFLHRAAIAIAKKP